jgi:hypothetical protein
MIPIVKNVFPQKKVKQIQINQPKGVKPKNDRALIKKYCKLVRAVTVKGCKTKQKKR